MARTITSANAVFMLGITGLFPTAQKLQGFSADAAFETEGVDRAEIQMGVDGHMSVGFIFNPIPQTITLQADSTSIDMFEAWDLANASTKSSLRAFGIIRLPSTGKEYALLNGVLMRWPPAPIARRVLQPRVASITWENITPSLI